MRNTVFVGVTVVKFVKVYIMILIFLSIVFEYVI